MKKTILAMVLFVFVLGTQSVYSQKKGKPFVGTVSYGVELVGIPSQQAPTDIVMKLSGEKVLMSDILVLDRTVYRFMDLSPYLNPMRGEGAEFEYKGEGKVYVEQKVTQEELDSTLISEDYRIEYLDETKDILGYKCKKAILHRLSEDGEMLNSDVWYTNEIGPEYDLMIASGLKGFPLEVTLNLGAGKQQKFIAKEVKKEKIKDVEFLMRAGYDKITEEQLNEIFTILQEMMEANQ